MKLILLISISLLSFSTLKSQSKQAMHFMDEYKCVAHQNINGKLLDLEKWEETDTLYYKIEGELMHLTHKSLKKYLLTLEDLTGIAFCETRDKGKVDIVMYFGDLQDYFRHINSSVPRNLSSSFDNWNNRKYNDKKQLTSASFCVDPKKTKTPDRCRYNVKKGLLKSIGFWGQSSNPNSIFYKYNTKENLRLDKNDMKIIKLHYNGYIKAGMSPIKSHEILNSKIDIESFLKQKL